MSALAPSPKPTGIVCTACGCSWEKHLTGPRKTKPTLEDCVRVLKAELAARPKYNQFPFAQQTNWGNISASAAVPLYGNQLGKIT